MQNIFPDEITFVDSFDAFKQAIAANDLTVNPLDNNYAGNYMYMHTSEGKHRFKNIITRRYDITTKDVTND